MADKIAALKYNSHKGNGAMIRLYNPADVTNKYVRMQTQAGIAAFNIVDPGQGDTGIRINTHKGIKEIKSYLYSQNENVRKIGYNPGGSATNSPQEYFYVSGGYWYARPTILYTQIERVTDFVATGYCIGDEYMASYFALFIYTTTTGWWNVSSQFNTYLMSDVTGAYIKDFTAKTFNLGGEYTITKFIMVPWYFNSSYPSYSAGQLFNSYGYNVTELVYH